MVAVTASLLPLTDMKRTSLPRTALTVVCLLLLSGLPWGCSEFGRVLLDHPDCCIEEKQQVQTKTNELENRKTEESQAESAYQTAGSNLFVAQNELAAAEAEADIACVLPSDNPEFPGAETNCNNSKSKVASSGLKVRQEELNLIEKARALLTAKENRINAEEALEEAQANLDDCNKKCHKEPGLCCLDQLNSLRKAKATLDFALIDRDNAKTAEEQAQNKQLIALTKFGAASLAATRDCASPGTLTLFGAIKCAYRVFQAVQANTNLMNANSNLQDASSNYTLKKTKVDLATFRQGQAQKAYDDCKASCSQ